MATTQPTQADDGQHTTNGETEMFGPGDPLWEAVEDVPFVGYATSHSLRDAGFETVGDVWEASIDDLTGVPIIGEKVARLIKARLGDFTGIESVGESKQASLVMYGISPSRVAEMSPGELAEVPGVGIETAEAIIEAVTADTSSMGRPDLVENGTEESSEGLDDLFA